MKNIVIFGASGGLGQAFCHLLANRYPLAEIHAVARRPIQFEPANIFSHTLDYDDEIAICDLIGKVSHDKPLDCVIVAMGLLHDNANILPEKTVKYLNAAQLHQVFHVNTVIPMLIAKYALSALNRDSKSIFAILSARVGSISDNRLGGWYAYRASKAALNMAIKNFSIEMQRKNPQALIVGLHPGTVDSELSKPFQRNVPPNKLFCAEQATQYLLTVMEGLTGQDSGKIWAWDGQEILP